jgi:elongation factor Ts
MAEITATLVKELREKSGAGMMDCKKALKETDGSLEEAVDWLRTKGLASAAKKAGRVASEGLVGIATNGTQAAILEVNSETDFVARNNDFQAFVSNITDLAISAGNLDNLKVSAYPDEDRNVEEQLTHMIATVGENMALRRMSVLSVDNGIIASYMHNAISNGIGKIGVLVALQSDGNTDKLNALGKQLAMHIAAAAPQSVSSADLDLGVVERERQILSDQARDTGKPEDIIEKMVEGRIRKFYEEVCLLEQTYVVDGESKISEVLDKAAQELGCSISITAFDRFALGEGIEKEKEDYASEVAALAGT